MTLDAEGDLAAFLESVIRLKRSLDRAFGEAPTTLVMGRAKGER